MIVSGLGVTLLFLDIQATPTSTLFPYTTLFRSVFGNGITSRRLSAPVRIITIRSSPSAIPPCGGIADRKSTRLNSSHLGSSYAVFCLKKKRRHPPLAFPPCL